MDGGRRRPSSAKLLVVASLAAWRGPWASAGGAPRALDELLKPLAGPTPLPTTPRRTCAQPCKTVPASKTYTQEVYGTSSRCFGGSSTSGEVYACFEVQCMAKLFSKTTVYGHVYSLRIASGATATCNQPETVVSFPGFAGNVTCDAPWEVCQANGHVKPDIIERRRPEVSAELRARYADDAIFTPLLAAFDAGRFYPHLPSERPIADQYLIRRKQAGCVFSGAQGLPTVQIPTLNLETVSSLSGAALVTTLSATNTGCVDYVEQDFKLHNSSAVLRKVPWGLDQTDAKVDGVFTSHFSGRGVDVYILDTGVDALHAELAPRVQSGVDFTSDVPSAANRDVQGHGTHVAGTCCGYKTGLAPAANVIPMKVLSNDGTGSSSWTMSAVDYIVQEKQRRDKAGGAPMVASASLGGPRSELSNRAWRTLVNAGVTAVVAAGNENQDASLGSPASEPSVITVGAIDEAGSAASFSSYGDVLDIWAPGVSIMSAKTGGGYVAMSGTSMATPMVTGAAAQILSAQPTWSASQVEQELETRCNTDVGSLKSSTGKIMRSFASLGGACVLASPLSPAPGPPPGQAAAPTGNSGAMVGVIAGICCLLCCCFVISALVLMFIKQQGSADSSEASGSDSDTEPYAPARYSGYSKVAPGKDASGVPMSTGVAPPPREYAPLQAEDWEAFPGLAKDITACAECNADPRRLQNDGETVFKSLRRNIMKCPAEELEDVPGKAQVWDFLTRFVATRNFYRPQASEVSMKLESCLEWAEVLYQEPDLMRRKEQWIG